MNKQSDLQQAVNRIGLQRIELYWFFQVLLEREVFLDEAFRLLNALLDAGLRVTTATDDQFIDQAEIVAALTKVESAYDAEGEAVDLDKAWWDVLVAARQSDGQEYEEPVGRLIVNEINVAEVCAQLGASTYSWPNVKWPQRREDISVHHISAPNHSTTRTVESQSDLRACGSPMLSPQSPETPNLSDRNGDTSNVFNRRMLRFKTWLLERATPQKQGIFQIDQLTKDQVYDAIKSYPEFALSGKSRNRPIDFKTFHRDFWIKQKIAVLLLK